MVAEVRGGQLPAATLPGIDSIDALRTLAKRRLPRAIFDFFDGGAEDEETLRENRAALRRLKFIPRVLNDVSTVDTGTDLLGRHADLPIAIAPTGAVGFGRPGGDLAIARAAAALGLPYTLSSSATVSIEDIASKAPGRHWFQAYILHDRMLFERLLQRAFDADYEALMITVDLPVGGKRERDLRNHFSIPFRLTPRNTLDFAQHPRWLWQMARAGIPVMENLRGLAPPKASATGIASSVGRSYDPSFDWSRLAAIRDGWSRKLVVKGVLHPADAQRLVELGVDALVVSNHGGRQLDGALATIDALPAIAGAVAGRVPVFVDGGIRRGADIVRARALGAQAVLVGRATLYGAIAAGEPGAAHALAILADELRRTLQLCGVSRFNDVDARLLTQQAATTPRN